MAHVHERSRQKGTRQFFFVAHGDCSLETHPVMCTLSIPGKGNALVHRFCGRSPMVSQYFVLLLLDVCSS